MKVKIFEKRASVVYKKGHFFVLNVNFLTEKAKFLQVSNNVWKSQIERTKIYKKGVKKSKYKDKYIGIYNLFKKCNTFYFKFCTL